MGLGSSGPAKKMGYLASLLQSPAPVGPGCHLSQVRYVLLIRRQRLDMTELLFTGALKHNTTTNFDSETTITRNRKLEHKIFHAGKNNKYLGFTALSRILHRAA